MREPGGKEEKLVLCSKVRKHPQSLLCLLFPSQTTCKIVPNRLYNLRQHDA